MTAPVAARRARIWALAVEHGEITASLVAASVAAGTMQRLCQLLCEMADAGQLVRMNPGLRPLRYAAGVAPKGVAPELAAQQAARPAPRPRLLPPADEHWRRTPAVGAVRRREDMQVARPTGQVDDSRARTVILPAAAPMGEHQRWRDAPSQPPAGFAALGIGRYLPDAPQTAAAAPAP